MTDINIKDLVTDAKATFRYLRAGYAYYSIDLESKRFTFPVELSDIGNATLNALEKSITLMRYIRKAIEDNTMLTENLIKVWR